MRGKTLAVGPESIRNFIEFKRIHVWQNTSNVYLSNASLLTVDRMDRTVSKACIVLMVRICCW